MKLEMFLITVILKNLKNFQIYIKILYLLKIR